MLFRSGEVSAVLEFEPDLAIRYELVAGDGRACVYGARTGLKGPGYLSCWGRRIDPKYKGKVGHNVNGSNKMLSIGADHLCSTLSTGDRRVHCDGSNSHGQNTDPQPLDLEDPKTGHWLSSPNVISSGNRHNCALDLFGVYCWGDNSQGQTNVPVLQDPKWVASGGDVSCAIDANNQLICWGDASFGQLAIPDDVNLVERIAVGAKYVCATSSGQVKCWGDTESWNALPQVYSNVVHISAGENHVCVLDEIQTEPQVMNSHCFGEDNEDQSLLSVPAEINLKVRTISAGSGFTCATNNYFGYEWYDEDEDGQYAIEEHLGVLCWGKNDEGQAKAPSELCLGYHGTEASLNDRVCFKY